jgi:hypothetical protein
MATRGVKTSFSIPNVLASDTVQPKDIKDMSWKEWSALKKSMEGRVWLDYPSPDNPDQQKARMDAFNKIEKMDREWEKAKRDKEKAEKAARKAEREGKKNAKEQERNRIENLGKTLSEELLPNEVALSQNYYDYHKGQQRYFEGTVSDLGNDSVSKEVREKLYVGSKYGNHTYKDKDGNPVREIMYEVRPGLKDWFDVQPDGGFSGKLSREELAAKAKSAGMELVYHYGRDYYAIITKLPNGTIQKELFPPETFTKNQKKSDVQIAQEADRDAAINVQMFVNKLISKTEELAGKGEKVGSVRWVGADSGDPWDESTIQIELNDKRVTWKTKMIDNRSKLDNHFNQWPTRLVGVSEI